MLDEVLHRGDYEPEPTRPKPTFDNKPKENAMSAMDAKVTPRMPWRNLGDPCVLCVFLCLQRRHHKGPLGGASGPMLSNGASYQECDRWGVDPTRGAH